MLFGSSQKYGKKNQFSVTINGSAIKRVTEFKYLVLSAMNTLAERT